MIRVVSEAKPYILCAMTDHVKQFRLYFVVNYAPYGIVILLVLRSK